MYHFALPSTTASAIQFRTDASERFRPETKDCGRSGKSVIFILALRSERALDSAMVEHQGRCVSTLSAPELVELGAGFPMTSLVAAVTALPDFSDRVRAPEPAGMAALGAHLLDEAASHLLQRGALQPALSLLQAIADVERRRAHARARSAAAAAAAVATAAMESRGARPPRGALYARGFAHRAPAQRAHRAPAQRARISAEKTRQIRSQQSKSCAEVGGVAVRAEGA